MASADPFLQIIPAPPAVIDRPPLAAWMAARNVTLKMAGEAIGRSHEWVRRVCLPFDDERRIVPDRVSARRIEVYTAGEITPASFQAGDAAGQLARGA